jgi:dipeptidase E
VSGGNVFVLRQAMKLSGLDQILITKSEHDNFVYGGYSAGCCVLSKMLTPCQVASDAADLPYSK